MFFSIGIEPWQYLQFSPRNWTVGLAIVGFFSCWLLSVWFLHSLLSIFTVLSKASRDRAGRRVDEEFIVNKKCTVEVIVSVAVKCPIQFLSN